MPIADIADAADARLGDYRQVADPELLRRGEIFIAEGREVVRTLISRSPYAVRSALVTPTAFRALADLLEPRLDSLTVYRVPAGVIESVSGYHIHRGCLAVGLRRPPQDVSTLLAGLGPAACAGVRGVQDAGFQDVTPGRVVVLEGVANADNVGGIFRNAAAFGAAGVILGPRCCDPLYRKAIRVSMGAALRVPFASAVEGWPAALGELRRHGFQVLALTPAAGAVDLAAAAASAAGRVAILAGSEGGGLSEAALHAAGLHVRIPMAPGADSLNVATAVAIALHALFAPPVRG